jgi:hypothetical protein
MHSSLVMLFGRSDAGLDSFSDYRVSLVQRIRAFSRGQHVVSTIICWCFNSCGVGGNFGTKQREFFPDQALNHTAISRPPAPQWVLPSLSGFPPSYELGTGMLARRYCRRSQQEIKC